jgi:hypothetical protein
MGGVTAALLLVILWSGTNVSKSLLQHEWDRNDKLSAQIESLIQSGIKTATLIESIQRDLNDALRRGAKCSP